MKLSFFSQNQKQTIEPSSNPMTITPPPQQNSEGFFFPMPTGEERGDIVYWDPEAGIEATGAWVKLDAPPLSNTLRVLTIQNGNLAWTDTQDC